MNKTITMTICRGEADILGNDGNVEVSVVFSGEESFIAMTFGGRDGSGDEAITVEQLISIAERL